MPGRPGLGRARRRAGAGRRRATTCQARVAELGREITADYADDRPLLVGGAQGRHSVHERPVPGPSRCRSRSTSWPSRPTAAPPRPRGVVRIVKDLDFDLDRPPRAGGRGHRRQRPDAQLPAPLPPGPPARPASRCARCWSRRASSGSSWTCATSASPSRPSSSSATASTWPSATATCRASTSTQATAVGRVRGRAGQ